MKKLKTAGILSAVLAVVFLIVTVAMWFVVSGISLSDIDYTEVSVTVTKKTASYSKSGRKVDVYARYNDENYLLRNVKKDYMYDEGSVITAYYCNGKLYENTDSLKSETPFGTVYFVFLAATAMSGLTSAMCFAFLAEKKKKEAQKR